MMKKVAFGYVCAVLVGLASVPAAAQLKLPDASPSAKVAQDVGLTTISVEYSSPGVKGRKIWGELVPWDQPWRTGANAATKITFSRDVTFGGKPVPAGTYVIVTLPTQKGWTVVLNKDLAFWPGNKPYDPTQDLVRVPATTAAIPHRERLTFLFSNTTDTDTSLDLEWEKLRVSVPIKADTAAQVQAAIKAEMEGAWRSPARAARYEMDAKNYDTALKYVDMSIAIQPTWYNNWTKAEILSKKGNYAEARKFAQASWDLGEKDPGFFFKDAVSKALKEWKDKK